MNRMLFPKTFLFHSTAFTNETATFWLKSNCGFNNRNTQSKFSCNGTWANQMKIQMGVRWATDDTLSKSISKKLKQITERERNNDDSRASREFDWEKSENWFDFDVIIIIKIIIAWGISLNFHRPYIMGLAVFSVYNRLSFEPYSIYQANLSKLCIAIFSLYHANWCRWFFSSSSFPSFCFLRVFIVPALQKTLIDLMLFYSLGNSEAI